MPRKCKCRICKREMTIDVAFKVQDGKKNYYYCTREEYESEQKNIVWRKKCMDMLQRYTNSYAPCYLKEFKEINEMYEWRVIIRSIKECEKTIKWFLENNKTTTDFLKARYIKACVMNVANKCKLEIEKEDKIKESLFKPDENDIIEINIMNDTNDTNDKKRRIVSDISEFL